MLAWHLVLLNEALGKHDLAHFDLHRLGTLSRRWHGVIVEDLNLAVLVGRLFNCSGVELLDLCPLVHVSESVLFVWIV